MNGPLDILPDRLAIPVNGFLPCSKRSGVGKDEKYIDRGLPLCHERQGLSLPAFELKSGRPFQGMAERAPEVQCPGNRVVWTIGGLRISGRSGLYVSHQTFPKRFFPWPFKK